MPMTNQLKFVHSADKLAKMRTKFHFIQAKLIMSIWCFTVQCPLAMPESVVGMGDRSGAGTSKRKCDVTRRTHNIAYCTI